MRRRRRAPVEDELFGELIDVLLSGWSAPIVEYPGEDPFRIFEYQDADLVDVWERHKVRLRAEATRRGICTPWIVRWMAWQAAPSASEEPCSSSPRHDRTGWQ